MASNGVKAIHQSDFENAMQAGLTPLLLEEWPEIDRAALDGAGQDLGEVVGVISTSTGRTKTLVKAQISELAVYAQSESDEKKDELSRIKNMINRLESKSQEMVEYARGQIPQAQEKVRENLVVSLLVAVGLGFLLGFVARSAGRR